eukprot:69855_1
MVQNNSFGTHHSMLLLKQQQEVKEEEKDQRIEVLVPPGKLGVVLYTKPLTNAIPEIWSINESSILTETVKVGDRIIAVDDQDTCHTSMDADNVSELISKKKKDAPVRTLIFLRPPLHGRVIRKGGNLPQHGDMDGMSVD